MIIPLLNVKGQTLTGAWKLVNYNGKTFADECIKIYSDRYFMFATYSSDGAFVKAGGGNYQVKGKQQYTEVLDFHTNDSAQVRKSVFYDLSLEDNELTISAKGNKNVEI